MKLFAKTLLVGAFAAAAMITALPAAAGVIVQGTRQIYPGDQREITVRVENPGSTPSLVQAWIDDGNKQAAPEEMNTPFIIRPPVFRLDGGKSQALRVMYTGNELPQDRESIYWLNVLDIPPTPAVGSAGSENYVQISLRTRIKLIYRPKALKEPGKAAAQLQWTLVSDGAGWALQATNPTPYFVHFSKLALRQNSRDHVSPDPAMLAPLATARYRLEGLGQRPTGGNVQFEYIGDQGGIAAQSVPLTASP